MDNVVRYPYHARFIFTGVHFHCAEGIDFEEEKKYNGQVDNWCREQAGEPGAGQGPPGSEGDMEQKRENRCFCRKCLLRDMADQEEYFRSLREYIENLDVDVKASETVYEERLAVCRQCDLLLEGMCRSCGCYVELRAAIKKNACPWKKWLMVSGLTAGENMVGPESIEE